MTARIAPIATTRWGIRPTPAFAAGQQDSLDPFPRAKDLGEPNEAVESAVGHRRHNLADRDLPLQVRVGNLSLRPDRRPLWCGCVGVGW